MLQKIKNLSALLIILISISYTGLYASSGAGDASGAEITPALLKDLKPLRDDRLMGMVAEASERGKIEIKRHPKCFKEGDLKRPTGNCLKVNLFFKKGDEDYQWAYYSKIYHSQWIDPAAPDDIYYTGDSYLDSRRAGRKSIPEQLEGTSLFDSILEDLILLYSPENPRIQTLMEHGVEKLSDEAQSTFHSETAFFTSILRKKGKNLAHKINKPQDTIIMHMVSTNPPCPNCTPVLKRVLTDNDLKRAISGHADTNLHIIYTYLNDPETVANPFAHHTQRAAVTFTPDTPKFLGVYSPVG